MYHKFYKIIHRFYSINRIRKWSFNSKKSLDLIIKEFNNDLMFKLDNSNNKKNRDSMIINLSNLLNNLENEKRKLIVLKVIQLFK